jgi:hypothetical protein
MKKSSTPPRITPSTLPDRLRNDGWWLVDDRQPEGIPPDQCAAIIFVVIQGGVRERTGSANN